MIKFFQRTEEICALLFGLTFIGFFIYNHYWTEDQLLLTGFKAFFLASFIGGLPYLIFRFIFRSLVNLDVVKPDGMEVGEEIFGLKVTENEIEAPEEDPLLSSPSYEELYLETERRKELGDETDPPPDLIELYKKLEDKRK